MSEDKEREVNINIESEDDVEKSLQELAGEIEAEEGEKDADKEDPGTKFNELNDRYLRLYAEFENYRKRVVKEKEEIQKFGTESLLYDLLTIIDTLEIALNHANEDDSSDGLKQGIEMTLREFQKVLGKFGLEHVEALGKPFDPAFHEAMSQVEREDMDEGVVIEEFRKGYRFHDKLLRPSLVSVSKAVGEEMDDSSGIEKDNDHTENNNIKEEKENG